ncbi:phosphatase SPAC5H10.03 [Apiospora marii]|uniref:Phosphatase SPAC5H10.03 n=1 Tax=Apiospora marii TaxID=335849 RepID=A0ABR1S7N1_9PEZI
MSPTIHLVRHGEAEHNVSFNCQIRDPSLTEKGGAQCKALGKTFPYMDRVTNLVASPLRRTVQTAHWAFVDPLPAPVSEDEKQQRRTILALGELQECSRHPCDIGLPVEELAQNAEHLDLSRVEPDWNSKTGLYTASEAAIRVRAERARVILRELAAKAAASAGHDGGDDVHLVVVSHGTMIQYLIDRPDARKAHFHNCEYRSYKFVDLYGDDPKTAGLVETNESFYRRYGPLNMRSPQEADDLLLAESRPS